MKKVSIAVLSALVVVAVVAFPQQALYDVVIHDGMIVDGTGNPWYRADIGIAGGRIQKIGTIPPSAGRKAINASGRAVSPGFIDLHTHSDIPVLVDGTAQSAVRQGVTLDVIGESASVAPLEGVVLEEFKREQKRQYNFDVDWTSVSGYIQRLERQGVSINIAISVAPQQIKRAVIGYQNRPATAEEIVRMKKLVEQAMREGAVGLSSAFNGGGYDNPEEMFPIGPWMVHAKELSNFCPTRQPGKRSKRIRCSTNTSMSTVDSKESSLRASRIRKTSNLKERPSPRSRRRVVIRTPQTHAST